MGGELPLKPFNGPVHQGFHRPHGNPQDGSNLCLLQTFNFFKHENSALPFGQTGNGTVDILLQQGSFCPQDGIGKQSRRLLELSRLKLFVSGLPQEKKASDPLSAEHIPMQVHYDREEPGPQVFRFFAGWPMPDHPNPDFLKYIFGLCLILSKMADEPENSCFVSVIELIEILGREGRRGSLTFCRLLAIALLSLHGSLRT